jgi:Flp pilus assembly protein TadD
MRNYPFALGIDGLSQDSWEKRALAAVADYSKGAQGNAMEQAHEVLGMALLNERKTDAALAQFRLAVQANPKDATARLDLGEAYSSSGQDELAIEQTREVVRLSPDDAMPHRLLGALLGRAHQPEAGVEELRIAARLEPTNSETQVLLGTQLSGMFGHLDDAIAAMQEAVRLSPESPRARAGLENLQALKVRLAEELAKERGLLQDHPNDPDVRYRLAQAEARAGDLKDAIRDFQKFAELRPASGSPHADLAELYVLTGDRNSAWAEVRKARELGTEPPPALLARLGTEKR